MVRKRYSYKWCKRYKWWILKEKMVATCALFIQWRGFNLKNMGVWGLFGDLRGAHEVMWDTGKCLMHRIYHERLPTQQYSYIYMVNNWFSCKITWWTVNFQFEVPNFLFIPFFSISSVPAIKPQKDHGILSNLGFIDSTVKGTKKLISFN